MKWILGPFLLLLLLLLLVVGVGWGVLRSVRESLRSRHVAPVRGLVGSEKVAYLTDPRVVAALKKHGLDLQVEKAGSREMAARCTFLFEPGQPPSADEPLPYALVDIAILAAGQRLSPRVWPQRKGKTPRQAQPASSWSVPPRHRVSLRG